MHPLSRPQTATASFRAGKLRVKARVEITPLGLLAIGAMVAAILLSVPPIVRAAREEPRRR